MGVLPLGILFQDRRERLDGKAVLAQVHQTLGSEQGRLPSERLDVTDLGQLGQGLAKGIPCPLLQLGPLGVERRRRTRLTQPTRRTRTANKLRRRSAGHLPPCLRATGSCSSSAGQLSAWPRWC